MQNKKILCFLIILGILTITGCVKTRELTSLMDYGDYKNITEDNIKEIEIIRYTEGGDNHQIVDKDSVTGIYNNLKNKKLGKKTDRSCEDNTTVYAFTLNDETKITIEIECDWVVIGKDRYVLE